VNCGYRRECDLVGGLDVQSGRCIRHISQYLKFEVTLEFVDGRVIASATIFSEPMDPRKAMRLFGC